MEPASSSPHTSVPGDDIPSVGELSAQFAAQKRAKSPPLAFEPTPNDSLAPRRTSSSSHGNVTSPPREAQGMGRLSPPPQASTDAQQLQIIIDQQAAAIQLLHDAFSAERQAWSMEKERMYTRIASLEKLLRSGDGYSPAKSPVLSPFNGFANLSSPQARAVATSHRLPSIAEDENIQPLSARREGAPRSIEMPSDTPYNSKRPSSVGFTDGTPGSVKVEEIIISPSATERTLSPPPFNYRMEAGHTPLKAPRPPTPPPQNSMSMDGIEDTPTRNNTHINTFLTRSNDEDSDKELKGPLNMPELPHRPDDGNFTFDMLSKKLKQIEENPDQADAKPMVFAQPSPGLASPADKGSEMSPKTIDPNRNSEAPIAAPPTRAFGPQEATSSSVPSNALSPHGMDSLSKQTSRDDQVQAEFENGGIKLKKKPSVNFGAPFGQLGGFGNSRKLS